ncbi:MAG: hypothetical protein ACOC6C_03030 [Verrucomicrobiota bacterium]
MTWKRSESSRRSSWTKAQIQAARRTRLKPMLEAMGYKAQPMKNGNYLLCRLAAEIVIKDHYWINKEDGSAGDAIDFLINVENMTFNEAMELLTS